METHRRYPRGTRHPRPRLLILVVLIFLHPAVELAAQGLPFCPTDGPVQVNDNYQADANGKWWLIANWCDTTGENKLDTQDNYNFAESGSPDDPIVMADPTVIQVNDWFYITGTSDDEDLAVTANFPIYRTKDFHTFELHMIAYDNQGLGGSGQSRNGGILTLSDSSAEEIDDMYSGMWAPHFYFDQDTVENNPWIFLAFTGERSTECIPGNCPPDTVRSIHQARMRAGFFLDWHDIADPLTDDGPRFHDRRDGQSGHPLQYAYRVNNTTGAWMRDSGLAQGRGALIPTSVMAEDIEAGVNGKVSTVDGVLAHQRDAGVFTPETVMYIDPFFFHDVNKTSGELGRRQMLYVTINGEGPDLGDKTTRGNFVASFEMYNDLFPDVGGTLCFLGNNRNIYNKIHGKNLAGEFTLLDNGIVKRTGEEWGGGGVAEGPSAFYSPITDRYYVIYSRNPAFSGAYQMVYRMTEPGRPFTDLCHDFADSTAEEHVLLRAQDFGEPYTASFGGGEVFTITSGDGDELPYLIFHAKLDFVHIADGGAGDPGNDPPQPPPQVMRRTVFFKEITIENQESGRLVRMADGNIDPRGDLIRFRIPTTIETEGQSVVTYEDGGLGGGAGGQQGGQGAQ